MTAIVRWLAPLLALLALFAGPVSAQDFPARPEGPILDAAQILPPGEEAALDQRLRAYNQQTGRAVVVATVPSLQGQTIERYAADLFAQWGVGGAERDQGVLLLVAPEERQVRIEVGYGLTPYITDILSGRIIRSEITPAFRKGNYASGITAGVNALVAQLDRSPEDAAAVAEAAAAAEQAEVREGGGGLSTVLGTIFWIAMILAFMGIFGRRGRRRRRRYGVGSAVGNIILWNAIGSAASHAARGGWGGGGGGGFGGGGGGFGGFGGGMSGGGGASGSW